MKQISIKRRISKPTFWQWLAFWNLYQSHTIEVPEKWSEVQPKNFLQLFSASLKKEYGERVLECAKAILPSSMKDEAHLIKTINLVQIAEMMAFTDTRIIKEDGEWMYEPNKMINAPSFNAFTISTSQNPIIKNAVIVSLPGSDLEHITCRDFRDAVVAYGFMQKGDHQQAWEVIQALLNPKIDIETLKKALKYPTGTMIIRYFGDCLEIINKTVGLLSPTFFGSSEGSNDSIQGIDLGWDGVFFQVAKDQVFGSYEDILNSKFHDVLIYCIDKYESDLKLQAQLEKSNVDG